MQPTTEANPYRSINLDSPGDWVNTRVDFAPILHRWEKYRLWYNGILATYTLVWSAILKPDVLQESLFWFHISLLGLICNVCFLTGPALEGYGRYFGMWSTLASRVLFLVGLTFTGLMDTVFLIVRSR